jgi:zinc protease
MAFYKARFADASNFTFIFVGSLTPESMKPLVETYLASLPATGSHETWRDVQIVLPKGIVEKTIEKGIAPKSEVAIVFSGPFAYSDSERLALRTMGMLLQSRLLDTIRQELGGTYSITVAPSSEKFPRPEYNVRIDWTCDPARTDTLVKRVFEEIAFVQATPLSAGQMNVIHEALLRDFERNSEDNAYLLNQIARAYENGEAADVAGVVRQPDRIAALTGDAIRRAAQVYLDTNNYVQITLMPEKK